NGVGKELERRRVEKRGEQSSLAGSEQKGRRARSPRAPAPAPPVSRWRSSSSNQHRPAGGPSTHPTSPRWSMPARYSRTASSSNDPTNQRVMISKSLDRPNP